MDGESRSSAAPADATSRPGTGPSLVAGVEGVGRPPLFGQGIIVSGFVALLVLGLALWIRGAGDGNRYPLAQTTSALYWILTVVIVGLAGAGAQYSERVAARAALAVGHLRSPSSAATAWAVPAVATFAALLLVANYHNTVMLVAGPAIAFLGIAGALLSRDLLDDADEAAHRTATTVHTLVIHAIAFLALGAVYYNKLPAYAAVPLIGLVGGSLVLETLERGVLSPERRFFYAGLGGLAMAEAMVLLNWWPAHGWTGGAVLLVCFYLAAGVLLAAAQRTTPPPRDLLVSGGVGLVALAILAATA